MVDDNWGEEFQRQSNALLNWAVNIWMFIILYNVHYMYTHNIICRMCVICGIYTMYIICIHISYVECV